MGLGREQANGDYLAFLDSDDLWFPWTLETFRRCIEEHRQPAFVTTRYFPFCDEKRVQVVTQESFVSRYYPDYFSSARDDVWVGRARPLLLGSDVRNDNAFLSCDLTHTDLVAGNRIVLPRESLHIRRVGVLGDDGYVERVMRRNFGHRPIAITVEYLFDADCADLFEVRGERRTRREPRPAWLASLEIKDLMLGRSAVILCIDRFNGSVYRPRKGTMGHMTLVVEE